MAESTTGHGVQFRDEIHPANTTEPTVDWSVKKDPSILEKEREMIDFEEKAIQIADADRNEKKKQVCAF
jgi:hypothetical protein